MIKKDLNFDLLTDQIESLISSKNYVVTHFQPDL